MEQLRQLFGDEFLCYVLHCEPGTIASSDPQWSDAQGSVLALLTELSKVLPEKPFERRHMMANYLLQSIAPAEISLANSWRVACGGKIRSTLQVADDDCLDLLKAAAEYVYPFHLLPPLKAAPFASDISYASAFYARFSFRPFCDAVLRDEKLKRLFPGAPESLDTLENEKELFDIAADIIVSTGRGGSFQLVALFETILKAAYYRWASSDDSGMELYVERVAEVLSEVRGLASGRRVSVPVVVGFTNIHLPSGMKIDMRRGEVRAPREADGRYLRNLDDTTAVFITTTPVKILRKRPWVPSEVDDLSAGFEQHSSSFEQHNKELSRVVNLARFAFLCASPGAPYYAPVQFTTCILDPLQSTPSSSWVLEKYAVAPEMTLDVDAVQRVEKWAARLELHPRSLDIAVRRTLSAVADRGDPLDGFIDAVLAWENMFSDAPETTMKVCGAISVLLARYSFEERELLYKELHGLYTLRSKIVHGAREPGQTEAVRLRSRAVEIAVKAMQALYDLGENGLLELDSSSARGKQILLGALDV